MNKQSIHVVLLTIEIFIPYAESLKSKRSVIKSLQDRLRARFNASIAEIAYQDEWQRSAIGVVMLSNDKRYLEKGISHIKQLCEENMEIQITHFNKEWL